MNEEKRFLASYNVKDYDQPMFTVDTVTLRYVDGELQVLLTKRANLPFKGLLSLPGGFVDLTIDESISATAYRKVVDKTAVKPTYMEQLYTVGSPERDPRGWSVTTVFLAFLNEADTSQSNAGWFVVNDLRQDDMAFDHYQIVLDAIKRLRDRSTYSLVAAALLSELFTLSELQTLHEYILGKKIEKKAFRRRLDASEQLEETDQFTVGRGRPAQYYRLRPTALEYAFIRSVD